MVLLSFPNKSLSVILEDVITPVCGKVGYSCTQARVFSFICLIVPLIQKSNKNVKQKIKFYFYFFLRIQSRAVCQNKIRLDCNPKVFLTSFIQRLHQATSCWSVYPRFNKLPHTKHRLQTVWHVQACLNWKFKETLKHV